MPTCSGAHHMAPPPGAAQDRGPRVWAVGTARGESAGGAWGRRPTGAVAWGQPVQTPQPRGCRHRAQVGGMGQAALLRPRRDGQGWDYGDCPNMAGARQGQGHQEVSRAGAWKHLPSVRAPGWGGRQCGLWCGPWGSLPPRQTPTHSGKAQVTGGGAVPAPHPAVWARSGSCGHTRPHGDTEMQGADTLPVTAGLPSWTPAGSPGRKWDFFSTQPFLRRAARITG